MRVDVISIFPEYLAPLDLSLVGKARAAGALDIRIHNLRDWTTDRHRTVDDTPYGGGAGMVMKPDVWGAALDDVTGLAADQATNGTARQPGADDQATNAAAQQRAADGQATNRAEPAQVPHLIIPAPAGQPFTQALAHDLAAEPWLVFACGRYEGIDARVASDAATRLPVTEVSIGDYVLNGGEAAVLVIVEAVARLLPGVVGNPDSLVEESHGADGLLEYPLYTKPPSWRGLDVPDVLLSGHHGNVARWRRDEALRRTASRRPDLIAALDPAALDEHDVAVLADVGWTLTDGTLDSAPG